MNKRRLWYIAESQDELDSWVKEWPSSVEIIKTDKHPSSDMIDVIIELDKDTAAETLGYAIEECEWMDEEPR